MGGGDGGSFWWSILLTAFTIIRAVERCRNHEHASYSDSYFPAIHAPQYINFQQHRSLVACCKTKCHRFGPTTCHKSDFLETKRSKVF